MTIIMLLLLIVIGLGNGPAIIDEQQLFLGEREEVYHDNIIIMKNTNNE